MKGPAGNKLIIFSHMKMRPLTCWNCDFESLLRHGLLSLWCVVCCQVEVSATA
jgi:hypothetical protein